MSRCRACSCEDDVHRSLRTGEHIYIYCRDCMGQHLEKNESISPAGIPYTTYCYVIGDPNSGIWGGNYFKAHRSRRSWPPELSRVSKPLPPKRVLEEQVDK